MKPSLLLKKTDFNHYLVDAPVLPRNVLSEGTLPFNKTDHFNAEAHIIKSHPHKEVLAAVRCLATFVRRECRFGGQFDIDAGMLASGNYEVVLLTDDVDWENVSVIGFVIFTRLAGDLVNWELSAAYLLPAVRRKRKFSEFVSHAIWRYGKFVFQYPLSARMQQIVMKHKTGDIEGDPCFSAPVPAATAQATA